MRLYEHEGKALFRRFGIKTPLGETAATPAEAANIAGRIGREVAIKAQVLIGGRGKGGGIEFASTPGQAEKAAEDVLHCELDRPVTVLLVEERLSAIKELYMAITIDRSAGTLVAVLSSKGGIDIEEVADLHPDQIVRQALDISDRLPPFEAQDVLRRIGLRGAPLLSAADVLCRLYQLFVKSDAILAEINPLIVTENEEVVAADAKVVVDDAALFRHPELARTGVDEQESKLEKKAREAGLVFALLDGDIGILGGGAGLCMATMDTVACYGGKPANFVDMGGGISSDDISQALDIILQIPGVKGVIINLFGGGNNCETMAQGVVRVLKDRDVKIPMVVKMRGHYEKEGWAILERQGLNVVKRGTTDEAVLLLLGLVEGKG